MLLRKFILISLVLGLQHVVNCQQFPDSLKNLLSTQSSNPNKISNAFFELGQFYLETQFHPDSCEKYVNKGILVSTGKKNKDGVLKGMYLLGKLASIQGKNEQCDSILTQAYKIKGINKNSIDFVNFLNLWGITKDLLADYSGALNVYLEGINIAKKNEMNIELAKLYNNISIVYRYMGEDERTLKYLKKATLQMVANTGDSSHMYTNSNLADLYLKLGHLDSVRNMFPKALEYFTKKDHHGATANWLMIRGLVETRESNFSEALSYYNKALTEIQFIDKELDNYILNARCNYDIGELYFKLDDFKAALKSYKKANSFENLYEDRNSLSSSYLMISKCYEAIGKLDSAYVNFKKHHDLNIEIIKDINSKEIARTEFNQKLQKQKDEQIIKELNYKTKLNNLRILGITSALIILLSIVIIYLQYLNRNRKLLEAKLRQKNLTLELNNKQKEVTTNLLYLIKKNEFLSKLMTNLDEFKGKVQFENKAYIQQVINDIERNTFKDSWEDFEKRFQEVHIDFYKKLSIDFKDLTPNELKLCAFLKLNMTTKDISSITKQSVNSIKVARYRLRKKLKLDKGENLIIFLAKY